MPRRVTDDTVSIAPIRVYYKSEDSMNVCLTFTNEEAFIQAMRDLIHRPVDFLLLVPEAAPVKVDLMAHLLIETYSKHEGGWKNE